MILLPVDAAAFADDRGRVMDFPCTPRRGSAFGEHEEQVVHMARRLIRALVAASPRGAARA